jgi:predicted secreted protein
MDNNTQLVCIAIFRFTYRANILQGLLKAEGIESYVTSSSMFRQIDSAKLMVSSEDLEKARKILQDNKHEFDEEELEEL